jgi:hypothetical protein
MLFYPYYNLCEYEREAHARANPCRQNGLPRPVLDHADPPEWLQ